MALQEIASAPPVASSPLNERLSMRTKLLYGAPSIAGAAMVIPIFIHMPKFYADVVLVPLGYMAMMIALARSFDAITDPLMGWISDRTKTRWGRRRPYIALGAPLCGLAFLAMLNPPQSLTSTEAAVWFGATFIFYFLFHTVYVIAHYALGPELTFNYHERSSLFAVREGFVIIGTIIASAAPGFLTHQFGLSEREAFWYIGVTGAILVTSLYWMLAIGVRERPDFVARESNPLVPGVRRALRNRPFAILLTTYVVASITGAIPATMVPFFNAYVIRSPNPTLWLSYLLLGYFGAGFLSIPIWLMAARRFGKLPTWLFSFFISITTGIYMFTLGEGDQVKLLFIFAWAGCGFGAGLFLSPSMQADVIDYDEFHTGKRREAQYGSFWSIMPKFVAIPSAAIPIAVLASIGYVPNAVQAPHVVMAIRAIFALGPASFACIAFFIARRYPITQPVHSMILEGIERHKLGESAVDPLTGRVIQPPKGRDVDEETGWFLDYFSQGELKRYLDRGSHSPLHDVRRAALASISGSVLAVLFVFQRVTSLTSKPGAVAALTVVAGGICFALFVFHLMRFGPARRLASGAVAQDDIRAHLRESEV